MTDPFAFGFGELLLAVAQRRQLAERAVPPSRARAGPPGRLSGHRRMTASSMFPELAVCRSAGRERFGLPISSPGRLHTPLRAGGAGGTGGQDRPGAGEERCRGREGVAVGDHLERAALSKRSRRRARVAVGRRGREATPGMR